MRKFVTAMSFNMVANRADRGLLNLSYIGKLMTKLRMSKDKTFAENIPQWEEALKNAFATAGIGFLLGKHSSIKTPLEQVAALQVERELRVVLSKLKEAGMPSKVKLEPTPKSVDVGDKKSTSSSADTLAYAQMSETERKRQLELLIRANAVEITEDLQLEHARSESRGVRKEVIFLEPLTAVPVEHAALNPDATVEVTIEGVTRLYEPESDLKRMHRQAGWQLLTQSISDMPPANWKGIPLGDVYELYSLIVSHYRENDRKSVVKEINDRLANLAKKRSELFVTFHARYEQLILDMEKVGMNVDEDVLYGHVERAITTKSDDDTLKKVYDGVLVVSGKPGTAEALFEKLLPTMRRRENEARTKYDLHSNKKKDKRNGSVEAGRETALRVSSQPDKGTKGTTTGKKNFLGVCHFFQTEKGCTHDDCTFEHRKLSPKEAKELKLHIDSRRAEKEKNRAESSPAQRPRRGKTGSKPVHQMSSSLSQPKWLGQS